MKKLMTALSLLLLATTLFAQTEEQNKTELVELTIDEAVDFALKNSKTLKSNDIDLELKKRASDTSWNVFLPTVQLSGTMARNTEMQPSALAAIIPNYPTEYEDEESHWNTVGTLSASWNFTPAYIAQIQVAKAQYEAGKITWEQSQNQTVMNIKKLYYGILLQQESLKIQKTTLENARQRMNQAAINFKNGTIPEISYLQTQVNYENTKPSVDSAEQSLRQNLDTFAFLIGLPVGTQITLTSTIEPTYIDADAQELLNRFANNDLNIKNIEKNIEVAKLGIKALDLSTWIPVLVLNYSWQPAYIGSEGAFHFWGDVGADDKWYDSGSLSLTLAWNITNMLPWSKNRQQVKDTKQQLVKAQLGLETLKENQKVQVRTAVDTLNQAKEQIDAMGRNVVLAEKAYSMTYTQYTRGTAELLDLRDAETSLNQAKLGQLNQKFQYISALMDLENTLNTKLTNLNKDLSQAK